MAQAVLVKADIDPAARRISVNMASPLYIPRSALDAAERELAAVDCEIQEIQSQLSELYGCENAYDSALAKKRAEIKASGTPAADEILGLEEKIAFLESQKREIREALSAGRNALRAADEVLSELKSAQDWNTWDMFGGGGIITHMAKHDHLDEAQANVMHFLLGPGQSKLRKCKFLILESVKHIRKGNLTSKEITL